jgi:hypothetical protein
MRPNPPRGRHKPLPQRNCGVTCEPSYVLHPKVGQGYDAAPQGTEGVTMERLPERHTVRKFVEGLKTGTRVIWIATGEKGLVQPDKSILWDDGTRMTPKEMTDSHAVLIHDEPEWLRMQDALNNMLHCVKRGCTLQRWDGPGCKTERPERLCPLAVLSEAAGPPVVVLPQRPNLVRLDSPRNRHRA